ncbi:hypothetical protein F503_05386 [Ophiostoma piceae UAMH 11346]|uniref:Uncharacterized protein n=1 Tax=Ophiostoma piceae (strain UAMH 11346) TaxID=1262450 RepID=S3CE22_OPHP1|nr:hypothetical protein F503_05386 [Ophiostoma piceae UAMH 11346]
MATTGLARTRSLRRPQATGLPGASLTAPSTASAPSASSASSTRMLPKKLPSSSTAPGNGTSNTRLPLKPTRAVAWPIGPSSPTRACIISFSGYVNFDSSAKDCETAVVVAYTLARPVGTSTGSCNWNHSPIIVVERTAILLRRLARITRRSPGGRTSSTGPCAHKVNLVRDTICGIAEGTAARIVCITYTACFTNTADAVDSAFLRPPSSQSVQSSSGGSSAGARANVRAPAATTTAAVTASSRTQKEALTGRPRTRDGGAPGKPSFSTLQQHYSPAKNTAPKPRVAAILAPPASPSKKPANVALSAETTRLQTHLLQLHILHRDAADVSAEWHASARQVLIDARFTALAADHTELVQITAKRAESANAAALQDWASFREDNGMTLEEKIQTLDEVLAGVWSLAGDSHYSHPPHPSSAVSTSRFAQVVRRFERWAQQTAAQVEARQGIESLGDLDDLSDDEDSGTQGIGGLLLSNETEPLLDAAWHEECGQLTRRLQGWQRQLDVLGRGVLDTSGAAGTAKADKEAQPSLPRMLAGCAGLVEGMLEELQAMQQLAREAAEQELAWVRRMNAAAGVSSDGQNEEGIDARKARAGAIWRTV